MKSILERIKDWFNAPTLEEKLYEDMAEHPEKYEHFSTSQSINKIPAVSLF